METPTCQFASHGLICGDHLDAQNPGISLEVPASYRAREFAQRHSGPSLADPGAEALRSIHRTSIVERRMSLSGAAMNRLTRAK
jgi:hypothetical protein